MDTKEKERAVRLVRHVYGALIAAAVYQIIDILRDTNEAMIAASKISNGGY